MNALSTDTISSKLGDVADAVTSTVDTIDVSAIDLPSVIDTFEGAGSSVVDAAIDLADVAGTAGRVGGRVVVRTVRRSGRFVRTHPKGSLISVLTIVALAAMFTWYRRSDSSASETADLKVAA